MKANSYWDLLTGVALFGLVMLAGCGGGQPSDDTAAVVEPRVITTGEGAGETGATDRSGGGGVGGDGGAIDRSDPVDVVGQLEGLRELEAVAQVEAIERVVLLLDTETYPLALEVMLSEGVDEEARGVLMADLFSHEDAGLRLPALVRVAQSAGDEELKTAALNHLGAALGQDYGSNWSSWMDAVERQLEGSR